MWHIWGKIKLKNSWRITPKKLTEKWGSIDRLFYANAKCHVFIRITSITFSWRQLNVSFMFLQIYNQRMLCNHPRACNWHSVGSYSRTQGTVFFFFKKNYYLSTLVIPIGCILFFIGNTCQKYLSSVGYCFLFLIYFC